MSSPTAVRTASRVARSAATLSRPSRSFSPVKPPSSRSSSASAATASGCLQPQAVAVVGLHRPDGAAEKHAERQAGSLGQRIPRRHVEARRRDHRQAFVADEVQRLARRVEQLHRRHRPALQQGAEIVERRHQVAQRLHDIGFEIAAPDDALLGLQVDQHQRPLGDGGDADDDRPLELEHDRPRGDGPGIVSMVQSFRTRILGRGLAM